LQRFSVIAASIAAFFAVFRFIFFDFGMNQNIV
jgi:hypothetical protein